MKFIVKTQRGMEGVAANYVKEALPDAKIWISPMGYSGGLVIVEAGDEGGAGERILEIPEVERIIPVLVEVPAELEAIVSSAEKSPPSSVRMRPSP